MSLTDAAWYREHNRLHTLRKLQLCLLVCTCESSLLAVISLLTSCSIRNTKHTAVPIPHKAFIAALVAAKMMLEACLQAAFATPCSPVPPKKGQLYPGSTQLNTFIRFIFDCAASHCWQPTSTKE